MKSRVTYGCGSCPHYDGLADRCAYPRRGCVKDAEKPPKPPPPQKSDAPPTECRHCQYLNRTTGDCTYPGLGCVEWERG